MKPDWDKLTEEYEGSATSGVYDVDCTAAGKPLCDANGVRGFPTIKYGDPNALENYQGGRDFASLEKFASENLGPRCGPTHIELCDEEQTAEIQKLQAMPDDFLKTMIVEKDAEIAAAEATFKMGVEGLQAKYKELSEVKDKTLESVQKSGLKLMKAVRAFKAKGSAKKKPSAFGKMGASTDGLPLPPVVADNLPLVLGAIGVVFFLVISVVWAGRKDKQTATKATKAMSGAQAAARAQAQKKKKSKKNKAGK